MPIQPCASDVPTSTEDQFIQIRKPKFSFAGVLMQHPELTMDKDPKKYLLEQQSRIQTAVRDKFLETESSNQTDETRANLELLLQHLDGLGIDLTTSSGVEELLRRLKTTDSRSATYASNGSTEMVLYDSLQGHNPPKQQKNIEPAVNVMDYSSLLANINTKIDAISKICNIIPAPQSSNPLLTCHGTIFLQPCFQPEVELPTYFTLHKALLSAQSNAFFIYSWKHNKTKIFEVDADKYTLGSFVDWLYRPNGYDLTAHSTDDLLSILTLSFDLCVKSLHNAIVSVLINRHIRRKLHLRLPLAFSPHKWNVWRLYARSKEGDTVRELCAYLLTSGGTLEYDEETEWERVVWADVQRWKEQENGLGQGERIPADAFFM